MCPSRLKTGLWWVSQMATLWSTEFSWSKVHGSHSDPQLTDKPIRGHVKLSILPVMLDLCLSINAWLTCLWCGFWDRSLITLILHVLQSIQSLTWLVATRCNGLDNCYRSSLGPSYVALYCGRDYHSDVLIWWCLCTFWKLHENYTCIASVDILCALQI